MIDHVFVYPTDTVWGIGGSIESIDSSKKINRIKKISELRPVSVMFKSIEQIREYVAFPDMFTDCWLEQYFKLETTLAVPVKWLRKEVGTWIIADSDLIAIRFLDYPSIKKIIDEVKAPVTTTSFNLTGESPLIKLEDVKKLKEQIDEDVILIEDQTASLSGNSSSIVTIDDIGVFSILRKGRLIDEVMRHLELLTA